MDEESVEEGEVNKDTIRISIELKYLSFNMENMVKLICKTTRFGGNIGLATLGVLYW